MNTIRNFLAFVANWLITMVTALIAIAVLPRFPVNATAVLIGIIAIGFVAMVVAFVPAIYTPLGNAILRRLRLP